MYQHWHIEDVRELLRDNNLPVLHVKDVSMVKSTARRLAEIPFRE
jgi:hypothetical protein